MNSSFKNDLNQLEFLSKQISDLISNNSFEKILELDLERRNIINKIKHFHSSSYKNKINNIININNLSIETTQLKMRHLVSSHSKFSKRFNFYSLTK
tara:strand:+ start:91 stop:381 length:291 start_codon:yes stop_codon:yes gene_type:complete